MEGRKRSAGIPAKGYTLVRKWLLESLWDAYLEREDVTGRTVLVFLWLLEERAKRGAARDTALFRVGDFCAGTGFAAKDVRAALRTLAKARLIEADLKTRSPFEAFTATLPKAPAEPVERGANRLIPLQCELIRYLCRQCHRTPAAIGVALFFSTETLYYYAPECRSGADVRIDAAVAWTGLAASSIHRHLARFESLGWLTRHQRMPWVTQELGLDVEIALDWEAPGGAELSVTGAELSENGAELRATGVEMRAPRDKDFFKELSKEKQQQAHAVGECPDTPESGVVVSSSSRTSKRSNASVASLEDARAEDGTASELRSLGVWPGPARRFAKKLPAATIRRAIEYAEHQAEKGVPDSMGSYLAGVLAAAEQSGELKTPKSFRTKADLEAEAQAKAAKAQAEAKAKKQAEVRQREEAAKESERFKAIIGRMSAEQRKQILPEALSRANSFQRKFINGNSPCANNMRKHLVRDYLLETERERKTKEAMKLPRDPAVAAMVSRSLASAKRGLLVASA